MPAPVASSSISSLGIKAASSHSSARQSARKARVVRRRGRTKDEFESDEEIERELGSDSDFDDDQSSVDSASDSDTEPASEEVLSNDHSHILTPSTAQSSGDLHSTSLNHIHPNKKMVADGLETPFFNPAGDWSEMVADEATNGTADLPVIDFTELDSHLAEADAHSVEALRPRKMPKSSKRPSQQHGAPAPVHESRSSESHQGAPTATSSAGAGQPMGEESVASTSKQPSRGSFSRRQPGQSARQAYQQRLEADPSYVPTVGEFWGHDDRLLDKDLRSLSGWWRGRWQGRGRGRGGFDRVSTRGRGGHFGANTRPPASERESPPVPVKDDERPSEEIPPVDQPWTHDGFEEMKRREEQRRASQHAPQQQRQEVDRSVRNPRGRGGIPASPSRGRGGFAASPNRQRAHLPSLPPAGRTWYAMKPERVWTKQHEAFLYFDPSLRPRLGQGPNYRVKLSSEPSHVVKVERSTVAVQSPANGASHAILSDDSEKTAVVRLPKRSGEDREPDVPIVIIEHTAAVEEPPIEDIFKVRPGLVPKPIVHEASPPAEVPLAPAMSQPIHASALNGISESHQSQVASETVEPTSPKRSSPESSDQTDWVRPTPVAQHVPADSESGKQDTATLPGPRPVPAAPAPLQTVFSTPPLPSPVYGSPYGYASPLPPGIAVSQHGMPYEVATGRAVYLQAPAVMYNPRPVSHGLMTPTGLPFVPGHMHSLSTGSPDLLTSPHTPPVSGGFMDPSSGMPIFSFPRQSSRIEIRAPVGSGDNKAFNRRPSTLRSSAAAYEPADSTGPGNGSQSYFADGSSASLAEASAGLETNYSNGASENGQAPGEQTMDTNMLTYPQYQQSYYFPEQYSYPQYYDMSQVAHYEMYPLDPHTSQASVYY